MSVVAVVAGNVLAQGPLSGGRADDRSGMRNWRGPWADPAARAGAVEAWRRQSEFRKAEAEQWARARNVPIRIDDGRRVMELMAVESNRPVYVTTHNANAAISTAANLIRQTAPSNVDGSGLTAGIWDGGAVLAPHQEFGGRVNVKDGASPNYHSTHVGGTIGASGVVASAKGMAPKVNIDSYDWNSDISEMAGRGMSYPGEPGKIHLSNHSYGIVSGWIWGYGAQSAYYWTPYRAWGGAGTREAFFGQYDTGARDYDSVAYNAPYYLIFKSAGNDRSDNPDTGATVYYTLNGATWNAVSYDPAIHPPGDGVYAGGYDTIPTDGVAKNIVTIGAVDDAVSGGVRSAAAAAMTTFSGWGPADDGRIKPDLVANGYQLYSTFDTSDTAYEFLSGTSMSTPNACGSAALLVQYFGILFPGQAMTASTLKALLIHTCDDLGRPGPDYSYGWGLMNVKAGADLIREQHDQPSACRMVEGVLNAANPDDEYIFDSDGSTPIRATLCWTDPAGAATTTHDNRTPVLVNDLDLRIMADGGSPVYMPYGLSYGSPSASATNGDNRVDNVEQVYIAVPPAGRYTLRVTHKGSLTNSEQFYSLILSGQRVDSLQITPFAGLAVSGPAGGPFDSSSQLLVLTNRGAEVINWAAWGTSTWVTVSPSSGTVASHGSGMATVALTSVAATLPAGTHVSAVVFSNMVSGITQQEEFKLTVLPAARLPFFETFESGALTNYWKVTGTAQYRTQVTTANGPYEGSYHLVMDDSVQDGTYSRNEVTLSINLAGMTNVILQFWARDYSETAHGPPGSPFIDGADFDGVAVSADGTTWYEVYGLRTLSSTYTLQTVDLDAAVVAAGLHYNSLFRIRFNQYGRRPVPGNGIAIDNISIIGAPPGPVALDVVSAYGMADPAVGRHSYDGGSTLSCRITNSPVVFRDDYGATTVVCTGWTGTGSVPATGNGTNTGGFAMIATSSITWHWAVSDLVLSNRTVTTGATNAALNSITAREGYLVNPPGTVEFRAGKAVRLQAGFEARTGSVFRARVIPP